MTNFTPLSSVDKPNPLVFDELYQSHIYVVSVECIDLKQHINLHDLTIQELLVRSDVLSNSLLYKGVLYEPCFSNSPTYPTFFVRHEEKYSVYGYISPFSLRHLESINSSLGDLIHITEMSESYYLPITAEVFSLQDLRLVVSLVSYDFHLN